jgi:medium-chain acyl-[acyl-carrier-protein] hydrolase
MIGSATRGKCILDPSPNAAAGRRLFCLPFAGGSASLYWNLARQLSGDVHVLAIELPGRAGRWREQPYRSMDDLVDDLIRELQPWLERPFGILGQSMGALIAFELARRLEADRVRELRQIIVGAFPAPQYLDQRSAIADLSDEAFESALKHRYGFAPPDDVHSYRSVMALMLPTLRADIALVEAYRLVRNGNLSTSIGAFVGADDPAVSVEAMIGWRAQTRGPFALQKLPGDHYSVIKNAAFETYVRSQVRQWSAECT